MIERQAARNESEEKEMDVKNKKRFMITGALFLLFIIFTTIVLTVDVQPIGPKGISIGLATLNQWMFKHIGVHMFWYELTDWLGIVAIVVALGFATLGLFQLIKRKSIKYVDFQIILLGIFYVLVVLIYMLFENLIVNFRPIMLEGVLEASYPSSHTILVICIMATAIMMFDYLFEKVKFLRIILNMISLIIILITVVGRLISGVHWFSDIVAGVLLSIALVMLYYSTVRYFGERR